MVSVNGAEEVVFGTKGVACQFFMADAISAASWLKVASLDNKMPMEFFLSSPKMAFGVGICGCALFSKLLTVAIGSATSSAGATLASVMRFTKLELAPFSNKRRTKYGNKSSCEPTGA